ncbi:MAG: hypothetical protein QGG71_23885 [Pirellulaceae bacterium]|jgi:hypothetical protein|nr:hypothetical protein [Pirellulaceae bacterium]
MLHGVTNDVVVKANGMTNVTVKAPGKGQMVIQNMPNEGNNYLFVGLWPPVLLRD